MGRPIIYTDETFVHAAHTTPKRWQSENTVLAVPFNKGNRLIIVHAGSEAGFVKGAQLVFTSKSKSGDYHDDMNFDNFQRWLNTQLIPNLPVFVRDNAPYNIVQLDRSPTQNTIQPVLQKWLSDHNIEFDNSMLRTEHYELCKRNKTASKYVNCRHHFKKSWA